MARKLAYTVIVDEETFPVGTEETAELKAKIPNPVAWDGESKLPDEESGPTEPPRSGRGSGEDAWRAYAEDLDLEVPDGASRDDIIALVDARNTEQ